MNLALFDLDNTLLAGDSDHAWGQFLCDLNIVDAQEYAQRNDAFYAQYKEGTLDINEFLAFVMAPLARIERPELDKLHAQFMQKRIRSMITPKSVLQVKQHMDAGDLVAIVTATNAFVTRPIAEAYGVAHLIATIPAQEHGRFTGTARGIPSFREGKIARVETWLESLALNWQSFEKSYFYSDSANDLPLLAKVSHPIAVDPDEKLLAHAQQHGWSILSLR